MNRKNALDYMRIAGYHDDKAAFYRLYVEHRISKAAADEAWSAGVKQKNDGATCNCYRCNY